MVPGTLNIRNMTRNEVDLAIEWAAKEGWNPGIHDADCLWDLGNNSQGGAASPFNFHRESDYFCAFGWKAV